MVLPLGKSQCKPNTGSVWAAWGSEIQWPTVIDTETPITTYQIG